MKALVCEMCNSNDMVKQDGMYVCQSCGTKYSVDEAKKLMGTVKIDNSDELKNLYELARRAKNDNNSENAQKFYEQILLKDPSSWEANFYSVYYKAKCCKIMNIQSAAISVNNCIDTVLKLIKDNVSDPVEKYNAVDEVGGKVITIATMLNSAAVKHYYGIDVSIRNKYVQEMLDRRIACYKMIYNLGDCIIMLFENDEDYGDKYCKQAATAWESGIDMHNGCQIHFANKEANKEIMLKYADKIKKYKPDYVVPKIITAKSGCYVATAVYGSYDCPQVWTLRRYRDDTLAKTWHGRAFIHTYYAISPTLVKWFGNTNWFKNMWKPKLDKMVNNLNLKGVENTPYEDKKW